MTCKVWLAISYYDTRISFTSVYRILVRNGVNRLPKNVGHRTVHTRRYEKKGSSHHVQMDVKVLWLADGEGKRIR